MSKITTEDCKKFIVQFQKDNPNLEKIRFGLSQNDSRLNNHEYKFLEDCFQTKNWKRLFKTKPNEDEYDCSVIYISGQPINRFADPHGKVNINDIKYVRGFDMVTADGQIAYLVLEMNDGTLHLGDYIGD